MKKAALTSLAVVALLGLAYANNPSTPPPIDPNQIWWGSAEIVQVGSGAGDLRLEIRTQAILGLPEPNLPQGHILLSQSVSYGIDGPVSIVVSVGQTDGN